MVAVASGGVPERPAHEARQCMSCRLRPKPCRGAVVGFTEHEDARVGVGVAVPHVGEEMDGLVLLQMDAA